MRRLPARCRPTALVGLAVTVAVAVAAAAPASLAQSIFNNDRPTRGTPPSARSSRNTGNTGLTEQTTPNLDDASYVFPPIPWDEAARGVVQLTTPPAGATSTTTRPAPAASSNLGKVIPMPEPNVVAALHARYTPLVSEKDAKDFDAVYGEDERRAAGKPEALLALVAALRDTAKSLSNQPEVKRYVLLRAFIAARAAGAPQAKLEEIAGELQPLLATPIPSVQAQRAELASALADAAVEARRKTPGAADPVGPVVAAARANYDLGLWQLNHNYLEQVPESLARAERYAKSAKLDDVNKACTILRTIVDERVQQRQEYAKWAQAVADKPEDPKANADLARFLLLSYRDVAAAAGPAAKSGDANLKALASASTTIEPIARNAAVGMAMAPLVDGSTGKEKATFARIAADHLEAFTRAASSTHPSYTRARLFLSRFRTLAGDAPGDGTVVVTPTATGNTAAANTTGGGGGNASSPVPPVAAAVGNPVFVETPARRIVYVVDGSGSMMNKFDGMRNAMARAVSQLKPTQGFNCLIMQEDDAKAFQKGMVAATDDNRRQFVSYINRVQPHGSSDPLPALRLAFEQHPDAIYFLTDGDFPNNKTVLAEIRRLNAARRTKIHTIAFIDRGAEYEKLLRQIADESGGTFRFVDEADMRQLK